MSDDDWRRADRHTWLKALRDPRLPLTTTDVAVLSSLATWMDRWGAEARPGHEQLARAARVHVGTVGRTLTKARRLRLLRCTYRGHRKGDGTSLASIWAASLPAELCHPVDLSTAQECAVDDSLPRNGAASTAHPCATTHPLTPIPNHAFSTAHESAEEIAPAALLAAWRATLRGEHPQAKEA